jgi:SAM-dependent methyltransferase
VTVVGRTDNRVHPAARGVWRLVQPLRDPRGGNVLRTARHYHRYLSEWQRFRALGGEAEFEELHPSLFDLDSITQSGGGHYFYQDVWALTRLATLSPARHDDFGSRLDGFVGQASAICPVRYWDIRPTTVAVPGLFRAQANLTRLPLRDGSAQSVSCLHVAEHVGLGRYGDELDPDGTSHALNELVRILAPGGQLLFSLPVGRERTCFNAQRIWHPEHPIAVIGKSARLEEFSAVDDGGQLRLDVRPENFATAKYACGLYRFTKR